MMPIKTKRNTMMQLEFNWIVDLKTMDSSTWTLFIYGSSCTMQAVGLMNHGLEAIKKGSPERERELLQCLAPPGRARHGLFLQLHHLVSPDLYRSNNNNRWTNEQVFELGLFLLDLMAPVHFASPVWLLTSHALIDGPGWHLHRLSVLFLHGRAHVMLDCAMLSHTGRKRGKVVPDVFYSHCTTSCVMVVLSFNPASEVITFFAICYIF